MKNSTPGKLIVFEGIDGTGKSTQISLLSKYLQQIGYPVVTTREPTTGRYGKEIRELYLNRDQCSKEEELELFLADRKEHVNSLLLPSLNEGKIVLCDRYYLSTVAYQGAIGFDPMEILQLNTFAPTPDIALIFEISLTTSLERIIKGRGEKPNDFEQAETLTKVSRIFSDLDLPYIRRINAEQTIPLIHSDVIKAISPMLRVHAPEQVN